MKISMLPRFVVLKSKVNNKYLQLVGEPQGRLQFTAEEVTSPLAKFEVVMAKSERLRFVHLKCCSNDKYCVATDGTMVSADADEPEEDQSKLSCTLFEPVAANIDDLNTFRFKSVSHGKYAVVLMEEQERLGLSAADGGDLSDAFTAIDWWKVGQPPKTDLERRARALDWFIRARQPPTTIDESSKELDPSRATVTLRTINVSEYHLFAGFLLLSDDMLMISTFEATNVSNVSEKVTFVDPNFPYIHLASWDRSDILDRTVINFSYTGIPLINNEGKLDLLPKQETLYGYRWQDVGKVSYSESYVSHTVTVPPRTRVRVNFVSPESGFEVPFSYAQQDTLSNGTRPHYNMHDGTYYEVKTGYAHFEVMFENL